LVSPTDTARQPGPREGLWGPRKRSCGPGLLPRPCSARV